MKPDYWNASRLRSLFERADACIAERGAEVGYLLTLSVFGDEELLIERDRFVSFGWSRWWTESNKHELERIARDLALALAEHQSEHAHATGGPADALQVFVVRDADQWTLAMWPHARPH